MSTNATPNPLGPNSSSYVKATRYVSEGNPKPQDVNLSVSAPRTSISQIAQDREQTMKDLERAIRAIQGPQKTLEISVHDTTHAIMIKVKNQETGDVIREIPSEKILDVVANMLEHAGILIDERI
ncbi:flagellar protein FlaG [Paenibacillus taichungensis]|uniref:flagellar protein FlaG n=1 Tax=Paenibacillus taichungensis TaxID=484184 RepID=UPI0039A1B78B